MLQADFANLVTERNLFLLSLIFQTVGIYFSSTASELGWHWCRSDPRERGVVRVTKPYQLRRVLMWHDGSGGRSRSRLRWVLHVSDRWEPAFSQPSFIVRLLCFWETQISFLKLVKFGIFKLDVLSKCTWRHCKERTWGYSHLLEGFRKHTVVSLL